MARPQHAGRGGRLLSLRPAPLPAGDGRRARPERRPVGPHPVRVLRTGRRAARGLRRIRRIRVTCRQPQLEPPLLCTSFLRAARVQRAGSQRSPWPAGTASALSTFTAVIARLQTVYPSTCRPMQQAVIDAQRPPEWVKEASPSDVADWLGFAPDVAGLVGWDVFDAVLTPATSSRLCLGATSPPPALSRVRSR